MSVVENSCSYVVYSLASGKYSGIQQSNDNFVNIKYFYVTIPYTIFSI
jgi:hypothetical protein